MGREGIGLDAIVVRDRPMNAELDWDWFGREVREPHGALHSFDADV
jgi:hypothetical protein